MSKKNGITICTKESKPASAWDKAISDAQVKIGEAKAAISRFRQAIKTFELMRDSGEPFPGETFEADNELMRQDEVLRQSLKCGYLVTTVYLVTTRQ
ncbi:MAG: hypothetical protein QOJ02_2266 [Acidobacteriota bacterium]|jgi:predicted ABC-type ATPase|nr:hypothetical protein [Acidobacteriota bacterium]